MTTISREKAPAGAALLNTRVTSMRALSNLAKTDLARMEPPYNRRLFAATSARLDFESRPALDDGGARTARDRYAAGDDPPLCRSHPMGECQHGYDWGISHWRAARCC